MFRILQDSYGSMFFPKTSGNSLVSIETWTPMGWRIGDTNYANLAFFMQNQPKLQSLELISKNIDKR